MVVRKRWFLKGVFGSPSAASPENLAGIDEINHAVCQLHTCCESHGSEFGKQQLKFLGSYVPEQIIGSGTQGEWYEWKKKGIPGYRKANKLERRTNFTFFSLDTSDQVGCLHNRSLLRYCDVLTRGLVWYV